MDIMDLKKISDALIYYVDNVGQKTLSKTAKECGIPLGHLVPFTPLLTELVTLRQKVNGSV